MKSALQTKFRKKSTIAAAICSVGSKEPMRKSGVKKILTGVTLLMLLLSGAAFFIGKSYVRGIDLLLTCDELIESEVTSPDKKHVATVYLRNCGATTNYVTHLNLWSADKPNIPNVHGVISSDEVLLISGLRVIEVTWKDNENLQVRLPERAMSLHKNIEWNSIFIEFVE